MGTTSLIASELLRSRRDQIAEAAIELQWQRWPGLRDSFSAAQLRNTLQDTKYHIDFLSSALWAEEDVLFDDYLRWVKVLFENLGLPAEWLTGSLADVRTAVVWLLGDAATDAATMIDRSLNGFERLDTTLETFIEPDQPYGALAVRYLGAVLGGDRFGASSAVLDAVASGASIADIYVYVFQRAQLELGRLWQSNRISVAQEHFATAVTQLVMSQLYSQIFNSKRNGRTMVAACVGGELHELGMRMVADFFEMEGWDTHYLGASTPVSAIVDTVLERQADILALSATMTFHTPDVAEVIEGIRSDPHASHTKIIVGGYPFNLVPTLWERVGADGSASDAAGAISLADSLLAP